MTEKLLSHANLEKLLARLRERGAVYAPGTDPAGETALLEWPQPQPLGLEYRNFRRPPKEFLMPRNQTLLHFRDGKTEEPDPPSGETFLFGVRPCDARAFSLLDRVFLDHSDPYYTRLRESTTVIALACGQAVPSCFCTSVGGGPADESGADLLATALGSGLLLKAVSARGESLLAAAADLLAAATPAAVQEAAELLHGVVAQLAPVPTADSARRLGNAFESPLWAAAGRKCLGCGTCSFLCPTCHCFDLTDEVWGGTGRRVRSWDCCAYPLFTLHGSGHNPRPTPRERWRQRLMHKFRYAVENFAAAFCVGCGRCIRSCPAGLDLRAALKEIGA